MDNNTINPGDVNKWDMTLQLPKMVSKIKNSKVRDRKTTPSEEGVRSKTTGSTGFRSLYSLPSVRVSLRSPGWSWTQYPSTSASGDWPYRHGTHRPASFYLVKPCDGGMEVQRSYTQTSSSHWWTPSPVSNLSSTLNAQARLMSEKAQHAVSQGKRGKEIWSKVGFIKIINVLI